MEQITKMPGLQVYEYKLILYPHEDLIQKIKFIQKNFAEEFKVDQLQQGTPQLLLARFKQVKAVEERLIDRLRVIAMGHHPVKIEIKDFGSYPAHTIYMNVTSKMPVTELVKKIKDTQRLMKLDNENKPHFLTDAHFTIAAKLKPWQYEQGWLKMSHQHFSARFIADHMVLLSRKEGEFKYRPLARFDFKNLPVETTQGALF